MKKGKSKALFGRGVNVYVQRLGRPVYNGRINSYTYVTGELYYVVHYGGVTRDGFRFNEMRWERPSDVKRSHNEGVYQTQTWKDNS